MSSITVSKKAVTPAYSLVPTEDFTINYIKNAMYTLNDGGGIYTNCSRSTIRYNIILDTTGGMESSGRWANISHGISAKILREYRNISNTTHVPACGRRHLSAK